MEVSLSTVGGIVNLAKYLWAEGEGQIFTECFWAG